MNYEQFIISLKVHISDCVNHDNKDNIELQRCTMYNVQCITYNIRLKVYFLFIALKMMEPLFAHCLLSAVLINFIVFRTLSIISGAYQIHSILPSVSDRWFCKKLVSCFRFSLI